jgi:hypothetical protein
MLGLSPERRPHPPILFHPKHVEQVGHSITELSGMKHLSLNQLGPRESEPGIIEFGILLPWISALAGNKLFVKIIHERGQFIQSIQPRDACR